MVVSKDCLSKTAELIIVLKDCQQRLRSDGCLSRLSSKTKQKSAELMSVIND